MKESPRGSDRARCDELIDRYYDGDVDEQQSREARALVADDPRAQSRYERVALIGSLVREVEQERKLPDDFTDRVMKGILAAQTPRRSRVLPAVGVAAAGALALAASIGMILRAPGSAPIASVALSGTSAESALALRELESPEHLAEAPSVSIESVDFGPTQGAIFLVSAGVTDTMVVWTMDDGHQASGGRSR